MVRPNLENLEPVELPAGYAVRHFRDGDEQAWEKIIAESFNRKDNSDKFEDRMRKDTACRPERVLFITYNDEPVATASAWYKEKFGADAGYIHMVGVLPGHQGRRLGYWVNMAALQQFVAENRKSAVLQTDDSRLAAIKTYIRLGFEPYLIHENQRDRWHEIFAALGIADEFNVRLKNIHHEKI